MNLLDLNMWHKLVENVTILLMFYVAVCRTHQLSNVINEWMNYMFFKRDQLCSLKYVQLKLLSHRAWRHICFGHSLFAFYKRLGKQAIKECGVIWSPSTNNRWIQTILMWAHDGCGWPRYDEHWHPPSTSECFPWNSLNVHYEFAFQPIDFIRLRGNR